MAVDRRAKFDRGGSKLLVSMNTHTPRLGLEGENNRTFGGEVYLVKAKSDVLSSNYRPVCVREPSMFLGGQG